MNREKFDPKRIVVLEGEGFGEDRIGHMGEAAETSCKVRRYTYEDIFIRVSTEKKGHLVLSELYYPGWKALVNGKQVDVLCGNYIFRVVPLDAGDHEVHLFFVSWPFRIGMLVSLITISICGLVIFRSQKEAKQ
jgi:uncharacterized membrane protein YfhO